MNKKQYNNIIFGTVRAEKALKNEPLKMVRKICNNMGVALPQGDCKEILKTLKAGSYMAWKACTAEEAQAAANSGIAAIAISENSIAMLSADTTEATVAETDEAFSTAAVIPLSTVINTGVEYYLYGTGVVTTETITEHSVFNSSYLINQTNTSIMYPGEEQPGDESRVFADKLFLRTVCGKSGATGTIAASGCGICCLAMYALYKSDQINTNINQYNAVKAAVVHGTTNAADLKYNSSFSFGGESITVAPTNTPDDELWNGNCCIFYIADKHFVLVYGMDSCQTGTDKYLVADPDGGKLRTLTAAMARRNVSANISNITVKLVVR